MSRPASRSYHHGNLPVALVAAARSLIDQSGAEAVGLRETARLVGVSATAAYRHFESKDALLAAVAVEGFKALSATLKAAFDAERPMSAMGENYVRFALANRGVFRLMFGPVLADRARFPALQEAADASFTALTRGVGGADAPFGGGEAGAFAAWGLVHGLARLFIDGVVPEDKADALIRDIFWRDPPPR